MKITASDVNKLRKQTGAGMMDCKKALEEADGDFNKAVEVLRKQGQKVAAKRSDREASEGVVLAGATPDQKFGALVMLNCETDFVAKNDDFVALASKILDIALNEKPSSRDELMKAKFNDELTIEEKITEQTGVIGEKLELGSYETIEGETVVAYIHPGNRLASLVGMNKEGDLQEVARDVAMQVAAMAPISLDSDGVPQDVIDNELAIGKDQAIQEGKPEDLAEKIAHGRLKKFYKESTLLNQAFIKDNKVSIKDFLDKTQSGLTVTNFKRVSLN